jgi:hypothetical protein
MSSEGANRRSKMSPPTRSRRAFVKKAAYMTPAIVSMMAVPAFAKAGSTKQPPKTKPKPK